MRKLLLAFIPDTLSEAEFMVKSFSSGVNFHDENLLVKTVVFLNGIKMNSQALNDNGEVEMIFIKSPLEAGKMFKLIFEYSIERGHDFILPMTKTQYDYFKQRSPLLLSKLKKELCFVSLGEHVEKYIGWVNWIGKLVLKKRTNFFTKLTVYTTDFLKKIPFHLNSDNSFFIYEVTIQLLLSDYPFDSIEEDISIKIPVGDKILITFVLFRAYLHSIGIFFRNKFDIIKENQQYDLKLGYASSHTYAIAAVPANSKVADIGAGPYGVGHELKKKNCSVVTIDQFDIPENLKLDKHIILNLNNNSTIPIKEYDCILFLDIIEHLVNPELFLSNLSKQFSNKNQKIIFTTGNIAFFPLRALLFLGFFNYGKSGILDKTHTRLFTFRTFKKLIEESGLELKKTKGIPAPYPKAIGFNFVSRSLLAINLFLIKISKGIFSYQIYIETETKPSVFFLLNNELK